MRFHYCLGAFRAGRMRLACGARVCVCVSVCVVIAHRHLLRANCGLRAQAGGQHLTLAAGCVASSSTLPWLCSRGFCHHLSPQMGCVCVCVCVCVREREREREREKRRLDKISIGLKFFKLNYLNQIQPTTQEGNGNPLQYSCLENSTDRGSWWATVQGVAKSWTRLSN